MSSESLMSLKQNSTPQLFAHAVREKGDIYWWEQGNFWVITDYQLAKSVLTSQDFTCDRSSFFISRMPEMDLSLIGDFFGVVSNMMVMSDDDAHARRRRVCYQGFTNAHIKKMQPLIQKTIDEGVVELTNKGAGDFVKLFAERIPSTTLAEFFEIPESERELFYYWSNNMTQFFGGSTSYYNEDGIQVNKSAKGLYSYFKDLMKERRKKPGEDFLSQLLHAQSHFQLNDDEIISQAIMMLVAGQVTTTDQMCNNLYTLLQHPEVIVDCTDHPELLKKTIEECNRLDPAVTFIFRVTRKQTKIAHQEIQPGDVIFISTHSVNRDSNVYAYPDRIDVDAHQERHMSYGYGAHYCLGAKLAALEMQACFTSLFQHFPKLKLGNFKRKHHSLSFSGFEWLEIMI